MTIPSGKIKVRLGDVRIKKYGVDQDSHKDGHKDGYKAVSYTHLDVYKRQP